MKTGESALATHGDLVKVRSSERAADECLPGSAAPRRERSKAVLPPVATPEEGHGSDSPDFDGKLKQLIRLCREQSFLTRGDIEEVFPDGELTPDQLEGLHAKLRSFEVKIVDQAEVDHVQPLDHPLEQDDAPSTPGWIASTTRCGCI
jgi:RNA polymerase primary sigma factor